MPETEPKPEPKINPRFIYTTKFRSGKLGGKIHEVPALNADGHIDYAHQVGLKSVGTELISREKVDDLDGNTTWWATVQVWIKLSDGRQASALSCCSSRDPRVTQPGYEVAVAETRALKRAIAVVCNITEELINPTSKEPTRETVDVPLDEDRLDFHTDEIPKELVKSKSEIIDAEKEQFDI